jgi:hypothetical protein
VATTTRNIENVGKTVETMTQTAHESTRIVTNYVVQAQELNTRFAQRAFETWIDTSRRQAELGQTMTQQLFGKTEEQTDAVQALFGEWTDAYADSYADFFFTPFGYYREGLQDVTRMPAVTTRNGGLPIASYDEMNVGEVSGRLDSLSDEELKRVRDYERRHKNRDTLIEQLDRKIKASS